MYLTDCKSHCPLTSSALLSHLFKGKGRQDFKEAGRILEKGVLEEENLGTVSLILNIIIQLFDVSYGYFYKTINNTCHPDPPVIRLLIEKKEGTTYYSRLRKLSPETQDHYPLSQNNMRFPSDIRIHALSEILRSLTN